MGINIDILINAAGFGKHGIESNIKYEDSLNMVNLNSRAVLALSKLFLPKMLKRKKGAIINIAAATGFFPVPFMATYAATKAFVISFSQALAEEVKNQGVRVLCVCPGPMNTKFYEEAGIEPKKFKSLKKMSDPSIIAEQSIQALKDGKELVVLGDSPSWIKYAPKLIPRSILLKYGANLMIPEDMV